MKKLILPIILILLLFSGNAVSANPTIDAETNNYRTSNNLTTLETSATLQQIATQRTLEIAAAWPQWDTSLHAQWIYGAMGCIIWGGENLAYNFSGTGFATQWFNSPSHRANMLDPRIDLQGSAVYYDANTGIYFAVQIFADPCATTVDPGTGTTDSTDTSGTTENNSQNTQVGSVSTQEFVPKLPDTSTLAGSEN